MQREDQSTMPAPGTAVLKTFRLIQDLAFLLAMITTSFPCSGVKSQMNLLAVVCWKRLIPATWFHGASVRFRCVPFDRRMISKMIPIRQYLWLEVTRMKTPAYIKGGSEADATVGDRLGLHDLRHDTTRVDGGFCCDKSIRRCRSWDFAKCLVSHGTR